MSAFSKPIIIKLKYMKIELFEKYKKVTADDGYVLTEYKDGDEGYVYCKTMFIALDADISNYREITLEEHQYLEEKFYKEDYLH